MKRRGPGTDKGKQEFHLARTRSQGQRRVIQTREGHWQRLVLQKDPKGHK